MENLYFFRLLIVFCFVFSRGVLAQVDPETETNRTLTGTIEEKAYRATNSITATGTIAAPKRVVFRSENTITLNPGFTAEHGSQFRAEIDETMLVYDDGGQLVYETDNLWPDGNRIPDFSYAGYKNGEASIPEFSPIVGIPIDLSEPSTNPVQNYSNIINAIDWVADSADVNNGVRGAIVLGAGVWEIPTGITLNVSGVVLRGAGKDSTILKFTDDTPTSKGITVGTFGGQWASSILHEPNTQRNITTDSIPAGARSFKINNPSGYSAGDQIIMQSPCDEDSEPNWFEVLESEYPNVNNGDTVDWSCSHASSGFYFDIQYKRTIESIVDSTITLKEPLYTPIVIRRDGNGNITLQPTIVKYDSTNAQILTNVGIEDLTVDIEYDNSISRNGGCGQEFYDENHADIAIFLKGVEDAWVRDVTVKHFSVAGIHTRVASGVTIQDTEAIDPVSWATDAAQGGKRYNYDIGGWSQFILLRDNYANDARHAYMSNGGTSVNGIVFLNNVSEEAFLASEGHRHWSHGMLYDNHQEVNPRHGDPQYSSCSNENIGLRIGHNYGNDGTVNPDTTAPNQGWATVNSVVWNAEMDDSKILIHKPPTTQNFVIGYELSTTVTNSYANGPSFNSPVRPYVDGLGATVTPQSLYLAQLSDRGFSAPSLSQRPSYPENTFEVKTLKETPPIEEFSIDSYPNPFNRSLTIEYSLPKMTPLKVELFDILGRKVGVLYEGVGYAGAHKVVYEANGLLSAGLYVYRVTTDVETKSGTILYVK